MLLFRPDKDKKKNVPFTLPETWQFLRGADLLLIEYGHYYSLLTLLPLLAGGRPRILIDYHGVTPPELWGPHNREALIKGVEQRGLLWCADGVVVHSSFTEKELLGDCSLPAERLHRLGYPLAVPPDLPAGGPSPLRRRLGLEEASVLLFVGRLAPNKRVPLLVEALGRLRDLRPPVHVLVVGDATDLYAAQAQLCRQRAAELGVAERLHFLGHLTGEALHDAYRAADVFVTPSQWESFCIPVIEAMGCGLPVVATRCTALPETVGDAGLTFAPDDADDLARQVRRLLQRAAGAHGSGPRERIAIVTSCYVHGAVSGVVRSLQTIAETLRQAGHPVEVFTTCARSGADMGNRLPAGTEDCGGVPVHRFAVDATDEDAYRSALGTLLQGGAASAEAEKIFLAHAPRSASLLHVLQERSGEFEAVIAGPYLSGLTYDVAEALPTKTLLLPCFHDEPLARLPAWREMYQQVAGVLYHSRAEQEFAQTELGLNHPHSHVIGAFLPPRIKPQGPNHLNLRSNPGAWPLAPSPGRFLVYCGRYLREKGVATLLEYARRYAAQYPERFTFVFLGEGDLAIPRENWARDLGVVSDARKRDVLAAADALLQLSRNESLSLAALEAWAHGTPVVADAGCAVLAGHIRRCGGGATVDGYDGFARVLDDLWDNPEAWRTRGEQGRQYVAAEYGSQPAFLGRLRAALSGLRVPLREQMQRRGLERAALFCQERWRERFAGVVEQLLDASPRPCLHRIEVRRRAASRTVNVTTKMILLPVRVFNWGTQVAAAEGPGRTVLRHRVVDAEGKKMTLGETETPLPGLLMPGRSLAAAVAVTVPQAAGAYAVVFWAEQVETGQGEPPLTTSMRLIVEESTEEADAGCCRPLLEMVQHYLVEAGRLQRLPDDYTDVTEGVLAPLKRKVKRKLLGNFKHAYVDVLSRQQSALNRQLLSALQELVECCATLDHAVRVLQERLVRSQKKPGERTRKSHKNSPSQAASEMNPKVEKMQLRPHAERPSRRPGIEPTPPG